MKNLKRNSFIILIVTLFVLFLVLKDDYKNIIAIITTMDIKFVLIAVILYIAYLFFHALVNYLWVNEKEKLSLPQAFQHMIITQFFNGITPFSTGGQPMEIYMLKNHGFRYTKATNVIMQNFIVYQIALVLLGIIAITYNFIFHVFQESGLLRDLTTIGFLINTLVTVGLFVIAFAKKFNQFIIKKLVSLLYKLHIVKNKETTMDKMSDSIENFHDGAKLLMSDQKSFVYNIFLNFLSLICLYLVPLTIAYSMGVFDSFTGIESIVSSAYVMLIGAFVPIPGGTGGLEYSYMAFYGNFLKGSILNASMIMWRFLTYYLGMIIGAITLNLKERKK